MIENGPILWRDEIYRWRKDDREIEGVAHIGVKRVIDAGDIPEMTAFSSYVYRDIRIWSIQRDDIWSVDDTIESKVA